MYKPHDHCHRCGTQYHALDWPRRCGKCRSEEWRRINPVAVLLQPVVDQDGELSLVIGQRGIKPFIGGWAFIGGHVEFGEDIEDAALREFREETGIIPDPKLRYMHSRGLEDGALLTFFTNDPIPSHALLNFKECRECTGVMSISKPSKLCFPTHEEVMEIWFSKNK